MSFSKSSCFIKGYKRKYLCSIVLVRFPFISKLYSCCRFLFVKSSVVVIDFSKSFKTDEHIDKVL